MYYRNGMRWGVSLDTLLSNIRFQKMFHVEHPDFFPFDGVIVFCGEQGSGKSLSAVRYIKQIKSDYPKCVVVSNAKLNVDWDVLQYRGYDQLDQLDNGDRGIVLYLDEMSSEFNSLGSKDIDQRWFRIINMQRKRRLHVVATCPVFARISKAWREQFNCLVSCNTLTKYIQLNRVYRNNVDILSEDDVSQGLVLDKTYLFFRSPIDFNSYDTWERVHVIGGDNNGHKKRY